LILYGNILQANTIMRACTIDAQII